MNKAGARSSRVGIASIVAGCLLTVLAACSKKEEMPNASAADIARAAVVLCSYAPSQSLLVNRLSGSAQGSAAAAATIAKAVGLTAVRHSSGAYIFTGSAGYVAGTIGGAGALPTTVLVGAIVAGSAVTLELVCASHNHPQLVARVESAAQELMRRAQSTSKDVTAQTGTVVADASDVVAKVSVDAFEQASLASVEWSQAVRNGWTRLAK